MRDLSFTEAILEAQDQILERYPDAFIIGEGVPDPKAVFGTCKGLADKYSGRVFDSPVSEAGVTGVCIGAAIAGHRPIQVHQRMDFSLYAMDQIINNLAKWKSMFGLERDLPMVIRMTVGRGWGAGNQHAQNLEALFAHIPGLQVLVPHDAASAKGLLIYAVESGKPTIFIEHKWLHNNIQNVDPKFLAKTDMIDFIQGTENVTIVSWGSATVVAKKAAELTGASLVILNRLRTTDLVLPLGTKHMVVVSDAWDTGGFASEIISWVSMVDHGKVSVHRITCPQSYPASSHLKSKNYYPSVNEIINYVKIKTGKHFDYDSESMIPHDVDPHLGKVISAI